VQARELLITDLAKKYNFLRAEVAAVLCRLCLLFDVDRDCTVDRSVGTHERLLSSNLHYFLERHAVRLPTKRQLAQELDAVPWMAFGPRDT
jgi:hypothetical protein